MARRAALPPAAIFDALTSEYYRAWFRFHPETAVDLGVPGYSGLLRPYDDDEFGVQIAIQEKLLASLDELSLDALDADRRVDAQILAGQALIEHHELLEQDWRRRDPVRFLPINALYQLTVLPVADFARAFEARVEQVPAYLRGARAHLQELPELVPVDWLESALTMAATGADYLRGLQRHPRVAHHFQPLAALHDALERAARAVEEFGHFLELEIAPRAVGDFACGRSHFERILRARHGLEQDADRLHAFGVRLSESTRQELAAVTRELRTDGDADALWAQICQDHPEPRSLLAEYRAQMQAARGFVAERDLMSLPAHERLEVVETPTFLRHQIPFAAYMAPIADDPEQRGYYYVTPPVDAAALREHNSPGLMHTCVHEAWPGHHLQFVTANQNPQARSLPRRVNASATLYEGWALYCEQLMQEQGFLHRPEQRFILLRDRLWRALRVQLDVELQTRGLSIAAAADRMQSALGFPRAQALADLAWYTRSPAVPMGYATGWALLTAARSELVPGRMPLKEFHDRLLAVGSVGLPWALQRAFGAEIYPAVECAVFDPTD